MENEPDFKLPVLSDRLKAIVDLISPGNRLIDVGTDHCLIPITAIAKGIRQYAIASDLREGPLKIARTNILKYNLQDKIKLLHTDGLKGNPVLDDDCLVISGMGGYEIIAIMQSSLPKCNNIILQPQKSFIELRQFLSKTGYLIEDEKIIKEQRRFYVALKIKFTGVEYFLSDIELFAGPAILKQKGRYYNEYLKHLIIQADKMKEGNEKFKKIKTGLEMELMNIDY